MQRLSVFFEFCPNCKPLKVLLKYCKSFTIWRYFFYLEQGHAFGGWQGWQGSLLSGQLLGQVKYQNLMTLIITTFAFTIQQSCKLLQSQLYFLSLHWSWKWILSVSSCPAENLFNLFIVLVFTKVPMMQIQPSGSSDWAVFHLAHHIFNIICVMPPMFVATQWNSFW